LVNRYDWVWSAVSARQATFTPGRSDSACDWHNSGDSPDASLRSTTQMMKSPLKGINLTRISRVGFSPLATARTGYANRSKENGKSRRVP
jgi:hypothetical protein